MKRIGESKMQLGLTKEQQEFRLNVIGGSEANILMGGDDTKILHLWRQKIGEVGPDDLSDVLPVQMGLFTEPLNRYWYEKQTGHKLTHINETRISMDYPFMGCTLDGLTYDSKAVWDAKHTSAFAKTEEVIQRYKPQMFHNMICCNLDRAVLSVFYGNHKWEEIDIDWDQDYADQLIAVEEEFWRCVKEKVEPVIVAPKYDGPVERKVDMTGNNLWADSAACFINTIAQVKLNEEAKKTLKSMIEPDVKEAYGHGIIASRASNGAITIKGAK
jgi:predicted phage-related endonuclease